MFFDRGNNVWSNVILSTKSRHYTSDFKTFYVHYYLQYSYFTFSKLLSFVIYYKHFIINKLFKNFKHFENLKRFKDLSMFTNTKVIQKLWKRCRNNSTSKRKRNFCAEVITFPICNIFKIHYYTELTCNCERNTKYFCLDYISCIFWWKKKNKFFT